MSQSAKKNIYPPKQRGRKKKITETIVEEEEIQEEKIQIPNKKEEKLIIISNGKNTEELDEEEIEDEKESKDVKPPSKRGRKPSNKTPAEKKQAPVPKPREVKQFHIILESIKPEIDINKLSKTGGKFGGRFVGKIPNQAARKAFGKIAKVHCLEHSDDDACEYQFSIQEYKNSGDGKQKIYTYKGTRTKLPEPKIIKSGQTEYKVKYKTDLKSLRNKNTTKE